MRQNAFAIPNPAGEAYSSPSDPLDGFERGMGRGNEKATERAGREREGNGKGREYGIELRGICVTGIRGDRSPCIAVPSFTTSRCLQAETYSSISTVAETRGWL